MTSKTRSFVFLSLSVMAVGIGSGLTAYYVGFPAGAFPGSSGPDELRYVPREAALVAYADVREIMASDLRQRLRRAIPAQENGQREFQNQTGINIETDISHVVACLAPGGSVGNAPGAGMVLATGLFDEVKIEALMREHGATVETYKDKRLITAPQPTRTRVAAGDPAAPLPPSLAPRPAFALSFLKSGLVAVGTADLIRRAIDLMAGGDNITTNDEVMNLVRSIDSGNAWAVGRIDAIRGTATRLPAGLTDLPAINWFSVTTQINDSISGVVRAEARDDEAATNLRDVIRGFLALAKLQAGSKPEFQALAQSLELGGAGKSVALSFSVPSALFDLIPVFPPQTPAEKQPGH